MARNQKTETQEQPTGQQTQEQFNSQVAEAFSNVDPGTASQILLGLLDKVTPATKAQIQNKLSISPGAVKVKRPRATDTSSKAHMYAFGPVEHEPGFLPRFSESIELAMQEDPAFHEIIVMAWNAGVPISSELIEINRDILYEQLAMAGVEMDFTSMDASPLRRAAEVDYTEENMAATDAEASTMETA